MNPVKLKFRHGGEMLVSPIGLRFVEDPDHGPLVLIPELPSPRGYQLDMTLEEAKAAYDEAEDGEAFTTLHRHTQGLYKLWAVSDDRWQALAVHLGLPEGWEHLREGAAEVKGALVSQAEEIDALRDELNAIKEQGDDFAWGKEIDELKTLVIREKVETDRRLDALVEICNSTLGELSLLKEEASLFTLAERVGELEESRSRHRKRLRTLEAESRAASTCLGVLGDRLSMVENDGLRDRVADLEGYREGGHPTLSGTWTLPKVGEPSSAMFDRLRAAEKPKSAWRPLSEAPKNERKPVVIRSRSNPDSRSYELAFWWYGRGWLSQSGTRSHGESNTEFCPIPE